MKFKKTVFLFFLFSSLFLSPKEGANLVLRYQPTDKTFLRDYEVMLRETRMIDEAVAIVNEKLILRKPLYLIVGREGRRNSNLKEGEEDAPYFNGENKIILPYEFIEEIYTLLKKSEGKEKEEIKNEKNRLLREAKSVLIHTLLHELGHGLIRVNQIPVIGREEDIADSFATFLLIEYFDEGAEMARSAGEYFYLEHEQLENNKEVVVVSVGEETVEDFEHEIYRGEHSLDIQRFYQMVCYVYGSDPDEYAVYINDLGYSKERKELCEEEYETIERGWKKLLEPYLE